MKRVTITIPDETLEGVRAAVGSGATPNVSVFIAEAAKAKLRETGLTDVLDELDARLGPPSEEDFAWADEILAL